MHIPMLDLKREYQYMKKDIDAAIERCLEHQQWILGSEVKELEERICRYIGVKHCIGVASGTDALVLSLRALAIKRKNQEFWEKDDLILTTPFTFIATADVILRVGATPLLVDIDPFTFNIDPLKIKEASKKYPNQVVGIMPVHLYGLACEIKEIMDIAKEHNLFVVEDVAQAFGGVFNEKKLGSFGDTGCFSFFPSKNLGAFGDAGAVVTNDDQLAELIRMLRIHGGKDKYSAEHIGYKARLDTLQAAILLAKMKYIDDFNERRRSIAKIYSERLSKIEEIQLPITTESAYHVYHQYTIKVKNGERKALQEYLKSEGIETMVYYPVTLHKMEVFNGRCKCIDELSNAKECASSVLSLPIEPLFKEEEINRVISAIIKFLKRGRRQLQYECQRSSS